MSQIVLARTMRMRLPRARFGVIAVVLSAFGYLANPTQAESVPLDYLLGDPERHIDSGDKRFSHFTTPAGFATANIMVEPVQIGADYGFRMSNPVTGAIVTAPGVGIADFQFTFNVQVLDPQKEILAVGLSMVATTPLGGFAEIVERIWDPNQSVLLGQVAVDSNNLSTLYPLPQPYPQLHIDKDFLVAGTADNGASIISMTQVFPQTPEPATLALVGCAAALLVRRRRLSKALPAVAGLAFLAASVSSPGIVTAASLQSLVTGGGSFDSGPLTFSDFTWNIDTTASQGSYFADWANIDVSPRVMNGKDGLRIAGGISALSLTFPDSQFHATLTYKVKAKQPILIHAIDLGFNGRATGAAASAAVTETVRVSPGGSVAGTTDVHSPSLLTNTTVLASNLDEVWITKQIDLLGGTSGTATISIIDQAFSVVPEPATLAILGVFFAAVQRRSRP